MAARAARGFGRARLALGRPLGHRAELALNYRAQVSPWQGHLVYLKPLALGTELLGQAVEGAGILVHHLHTR